MLRSAEAATKVLTWLRSLRPQPRPQPAPYDPYVAKDLNWQVEQARSAGRTSWL